MKIIKVLLSAIMAVLIMIPSQSVIAQEGPPRAWCHTDPIWTTCYIRSRSGVIRVTSRTRNQEP